MKRPTAEFTWIVSPAFGSQDTPATAPEKIQGCQRKRDFSRPGFRVKMGKSQFIIIIEFALHVLD
jgi:hypothetical protein